MSKVADHRRTSFLREFHAAHAGATSRAFAKTGSYARLAAGVRGRVLDLACGDLVMPGAIGVDVSMEELARGDGVRVQACAQALPFRAGAFDACVCHLAFMLFDDIEQVVAELARVIVPGGRFVALLGGGPVEPAEEGDAFHRFLAIARPHLRPIALGDPRAKSERGWRELFANWSAPVFERVELELGGTFEHAWAFLGASYQLAPESAESVRAALYADLGDRVTCRVACYLASVTR